MSSTACACEHTRRLIKSKKGCRFNDEKETEEFAMPSLGEELKRLRELKGWSLRQVEEKTNNKVSNSYLSQLESGAVKEPSPNVLYALAKVYGVSYPALMTLAGYVVPRPAGGNRPSRISIAVSAMNPNSDQGPESVDFVQ